MEKKFLGKISTELLKINNIERYSRYTSLGAAFAERFNRTTRDLLKTPVFDRGDANWIDVMPARTKHYGFKIHSSTKL